MRNMRLLFYHDLKLQFYKKYFVEGRLEFAIFMLFATVVHMSPGWELSSEYRFISSDL